MYITFRILDKYRHMENFLSVESGHDRLTFEQDFVKKTIVNFFAVCSRTNRTCRGKVACLYGAYE